MKKHKKKIMKINSSERKKLQKKKFTLKRYRLKKTRSPQNIIKEAITQRKKKSSVERKYSRKKERRGFSIKIINRT